MAHMELLNPIASVCSSECDNELVFWSDYNVNKNVSGAEYHYAGAAAKFPGLPAPPNLSFGNATIPETSLPENHQLPRQAMLELLEHKTDKRQKPAEGGPLDANPDRDMEGNGAPLLTAMLAGPRVLAWHFTHSNIHKYWKKNSYSLRLHAWSNAGFDAPPPFLIFLFSQAPR